MIESWKKVLITLLLNEFCCIEAGHNFFHQNSAGSESGMSSIWNNLWKVSCDYVSNHLESSPVHRAKRSSINKMNSNIDFNDPEQLFNYLYPLAHVRAKDLIKRSESDGTDETGRSNDLPHEYTVSSLMGDLLEFWQTECELRAISKDGDNEMEMKERHDSIRDVENEDEMENISPQVVDAAGKESRSRKRERRQVYEDQDHVPHYPAAPPDQTPSMRAYFSSLSSSTHDDLRRSMSIVTASPNVNRRRRRRKKKKAQSSSSSIERPSILQRSDDQDSSSTEAPMSTTPAAAPKASEDDAFFSSYGGDIEYFFPLLSFGIPFDGEITFLGFHGFKGIFPYRR